MIKALLNTIRVFVLTAIGVGFCTGVAKLSETNLFIGISVFVTVVFGGLFVLFYNLEKK